MRYSMINFLSATISIFSLSMPVKVWACPWGYYDNYCTSISDTSTIVSPYWTPCDSPSYICANVATKDYDTCFFMTGGTYSLQANICDEPTGEEDPWNPYLCTIDIEEGTSTCDDTRYVEVSADGSGWLAILHPDARNVGYRMIGVHATICADESSSDSDSSSTALVHVSSSATSVATVSNTYDSEFLLKSDVWSYPTNETEEHSYTINQLTNQGCYFSSVYMELSETETTFVNVGGTGSDGWTLNPITDDIFVGINRLIGLEDATSSSVKQVVITFDDPEVTSECGLDEDGDGAPVYWCDMWSTTFMDCDDHNASISPLLYDNPLDGVDVNCSEDEDADGVTEENGDCNDADSTVNPNAEDATDDGVDQDCSCDPTWWNIDEFGYWFEQYVVGDFDGDLIDNVLSVETPYAILDKFNNISYEWEQIWYTEDEWIGTWNLDPADRYVVGDYDGNGIDDLLNINSPWAQMLAYDEQSWEWSYVWGTSEDWIGSSEEGGWNISDDDQYLTGDFDGNGTDELLAIHSPYANLMGYDGSAWEYLWGTSEDWIGTEGSGGWNISSDDQYIVADFDGDGIDELLAIHEDYATLLSYQNASWAYLWGTSVGQIDDWEISSSDEYVASDFDGDGAAELLSVNAPNAKLFDYTDAGFESQWYTDAGSIHNWMMSADGKLMAGDFIGGDGQAELLSLNASSVGGLSEYTANCYGFTWWYQDSDLDGYGDPSHQIASVSQPTGYVSNNTDCDDTDAEVHPDSEWYMLTESCDGKDNNCDGITDNIMITWWYHDDDGDGDGGLIGQPGTSCSPYSGFSLNHDDCNDTDDSIHPGADEICDVIDNDCDGSVDEEASVSWYLDGDGDNYGAGDAIGSGGCVPDDGYGLSNDDCNDYDLDTFPGAAWAEVDPSLCRTDFDYDGYGESQPPAGVEAGTDCDDLDSDTHPGSDSNGCSIPYASAVLINGGAVNTRDTTVSLTLSARDDVAVTQMCISTSLSCTTWVDYAETYTLDIGAATAYRTIYAIFKDGDGNTSDQVYDSIYQDTSRPLNGVASRSIQNEAIALSWSGFTDTGTGIASYRVVHSAGTTAPACTASPTWTGTGTEATISGLTNGVPYAFRICATDQVGNIGTGVPLSATPAPETDPPVGTVSINAEAAWTNSASVNLSISATDASGVTEMCVRNDTSNCATWTSYTSSYSWSLAGSSSSRTVYVWLRDLYGTTTSSAVTDTIGYDAIKPSNGTISGTSASGVVTLLWSGFSDSLSGIASYKVVRGAGATAPASCTQGIVVYTGTDTTIPVSGLSVGINYGFRVCAVDVAGNIGSGVTTTIRAQ